MNHSHDVQDNQEDKQAKEHANRLITFLKARRDDVAATGSRALGKLKGVVGKKHAAPIEPGVIDGFIDLGQPLSDQPPDLLGRVDPERAREHDLGGSVSVELMVARTLQGSGADRDHIKEKLTAMTPRSLHRYVQTLQETRRSNLSEAHKAHLEQRKKNIATAKDELDAAREAAAHVRSTGTAPTKSYIDKTGDWEKAKREETVAHGDVRAMAFKRVHLEQLKHAIEGDAAIAASPRGQQALKHIAKLLTKVAKESADATKEQGAARQKRMVADTARSNVALDPQKDRPQVDAYAHAMATVAAKEKALQHLLAKAEEHTMTGHVQELIEYAERVAELKERTQGQAAGVGVSYGEAKSEAKLEGKTGGKAALTVQGPKKEIEKGKIEEAGVYQRPPAAEGATAEPAEPEYPDFEFDIGEDVAEIYDLLRQIQEEERKGLTAGDLAKVDRKESQDDALIEQITGIKSKDAEVKRHWTAKQFRTFFDCKLAHLDMQLDVMRASFEGKAYAQSDKAMGAVAAGVELDMSLMVLGAKVGVHSTPWEFQVGGERFVVTGTAVVDAGLGAELKAKGGGAIGYKMHNATSPVANLNLEAKAFVGAQAEAAGAFAVDWNRKSQQAYAADLGDKFGSFLEFIGIKPTFLPGEAAPTAAINEILGEMSFGDVGDVMVSGVEARVEGKVGAGAEAKARAGFFGGVLEVDAGFGLTLGAGFSHDVSLRIGVFDSARLAAIMFARGFRNIYRHVDVLQQNLRQKALPAIQRFVKKPFDKASAGLKRFRDMLASALPGSREEVVEAPKPAEAALDEAEGLEDL